MGRHARRRTGTAEEAHHERGTRRETEPGRRAGAQAQETDANPREPQHAEEKDQAMATRQQELLELADFDVDPAGQGMPIHPIALLFPEMDEETFDKLVADVSERGTA